MMIVMVIVMLMIMTVIIMMVMLTMTFRGSMRSSGGLLRCHYSIVTLLLYCCHVVVASQVQMPRKGKFGAYGTDSTHKQTQTHTHEDTHTHTHTHIHIHTPIHIHTHTHTL
jgi:hypothetical protein